MEEEIKRVKRFENLEGAIKVYKEFRRFKNDGWIESIDPDYFFNLVDYILANSIPISVIQNKIDELNRRIDYLNTELNKCYIEREKLGTETDIDNNETYIFYMEEEKNFREKQEKVLQELLREE